MLAGNVTKCDKRDACAFPIRERKLHTLTFTERVTSSPDAVRTAGATFSVPRGSQAPIVLSRAARSDGAYTPTVYGNTMGVQSDQLLSHPTDGS